MVEETTAVLFERIKNALPPAASISSIMYEGSEIVMYTKNKEFFADGTDDIRKIVQNLKKRIILRPDPSICMDMEKAIKTIKEAVPAESGVKDIYFEPHFGKVVIEAEKPGLVIGKGGETLREIKRRTFWAPQVNRAPAIPSDIVRTLRAIEHEESEFRKDFLNNVGMRIHSGWKETDWIRITGLGACREVGRSCWLVQTPESRVLMDCGIKPGNNELPYFTAPEFDVRRLDAVIIAHAHLDHVGAAPLLYKMGYDGPLYCTLPTRDQMALLCMDYIEVLQKEGSNALYSTREIKEMLKRTITLPWGEVSDITPDIRLTLMNSGHILGSSIVHLHIGEGLYNILYSLDWKSPVTVVDKEDNVHIVEIGKLVDDYFDRNASINKGIVNVAYNTEGWKTIAFDPKTYEAKLVEITSFIRHPITEELYEVKTDSGKSAVVTSSHSLFAARGGNIFATEVKNLKIDDWIVGAKEIAIKEKEPIIDLFPYRDRIRIRIEDEMLLDSILKSFEKKLESMNNSNEIKRWLIEHYKKGLFQCDIAKKYHVSPKRIRKAFKNIGVKPHPRMKSLFPQKIAITPDFARFLGYYVSEGSFNNNTTSIVQYSTGMLKDAYQIVKDSFGIEGKIRGADNVIMFDSKALKILLIDILKCGHRAKNKRIPKELLSASKVIAAQFLKGYFLGDGTSSIDDRGTDVSATSRSKFLLEDVGFTLLRFGIQPTFTYNESNKMHNICIYGRKKLDEFFRYVDIEKWKSEIDSMERLKSKSSYSERIPISALSQQAQDILFRSQYKNAISCGISKLESLDVEPIDKKLMRSCFTFERIKSIKKVRASSNYVYDLQVEGFENFLGGNGFLFLHNTSDMKFDRTALYEPASTDFQRAETVIIESTYGASEDIQPRRVEAEANLIEACKKTVERGGIALIPSFAVERSQDLIVILERSGMKCPIYLDGMVWDATGITTAYPEFMSRELQRQILQRGSNPFLSPNLKRIGSHKERMQVLESKEPCIVIATSGMLLGGPSVTWFQNIAEDKKNGIIFVGYQSESSLGRKVQKGIKEVPMESNGKKMSLTVNCEVQTIHGLSGHSDVKQLVNYLRRLKHTPERIVINHGEASKCLEFAKTAHRVMKCETIAPRALEALRLK